MNELREKEMNNTVMENQKVSKISRVFQGVVVSTKMAKTLSVKVERIFRHPLFDKPIKRHKVFKVHDENLEAKVGDVVVIRQCRPISKTKHMILHEIVKS